MPRVDINYFKLGSLSSETQSELHELLDVTNILRGGQVPWVLGTDR